MPRGCLGYVVADHDTRLAAIVDPELEMVEPMIGLLFKHGLRPAYIIDTHTHADHVYGARDLKCKTIAKLVMHEEAPSGAIDIRVKDGDWIFASPVSRERPLKMALFGKNDVRHPRIGGRPSHATR